MRALKLCLTILAAASVLGGTASAQNVLFLNKSAGFEHSVIRLKKDGTTHAGEVMKELTGSMGAKVTETKDASLINADNLKNYDVVVFYTTEDLTKKGKVDTPPMGPNGIQDLLDWVKAGGGFIGYHCASDTFHRARNQFSPESPYLDMVGGEFAGHGRQFIGNVVVTSPEHPTAARIPQPWVIIDEWYIFSDLMAETMHVIALLDPGAERNKQKMYDIPAYPIIWCSQYGDGRVYYNAMGHREDVWTNPDFKNTVIDAIRWAAGEGDLHAEPNFAEVVPTTIPEDAAAKDKGSGKKKRR